MYVILFSENGGSFSDVETELPAPEDTQGGAQVWVDIFYRMDLRQSMLVHSLHTAAVR